MTRRDLPGPPTRRKRSRSQRRRNGRGRSRGRPWGRSRSMELRVQGCRKGSRRRALAGSFVCAAGEGFQLGLLPPEAGVGARGFDKGIMRAQLDHAAVLEHVDAIGAARAASRCEIMMTVFVRASSCTSSMMALSLSASMFEVASSSRCSSRGVVQQRSGHGQALALAARRCGRPRPRGHPSPRPRARSHQGGSRVSTCHSSSSVAVGFASARFERSVPLNR